MAKHTTSTVGNLAIWLSTRAILHVFLCAIPVSHQRLYVDDHAPGPTIWCAAGGGIVTIPLGIGMTFYAITLAVCRGGLASSWYRAQKVFQDDERREPTSPSG